MSRCPSCEHGLDIHDVDGRCWFTVATGEPGTNLVCPCKIERGALMNDVSQHVDHDEQARSTDQAAEQVAPGELAVREHGVLPAARRLAPRTREE